MDLNWCIHGCGRSTMENNLYCTAKCFFDSNATQSRISSTITSRQSNTISTEIFAPVRMSRIITTKEVYKRPKYNFSWPEEGDVDDIEPMSFESGVEV